MDLISTLTVFGTILGFGAVVGTALGALFAHDKDDPRRSVKRSIITSGTLFALIGILILQLFVAPESSILTLIPHVPFPGATLQACSVTMGDLPHGTKSTFAPTSDPSIDGITLTIRGGSALSGPVTVAASAFDRLNHTTTVVHASNSSQGIEDVEAGNADIGLSGNFREDDPAAKTSHYFTDLADQVLAIVPFAMVVSPDIQGTVQNLTSQQLINIYNGAYTNWRQVGGPNETITVVNRATGSATRNTFELFVTRSQSRQGIGVEENTTAEVLSLVANSNGSIGYAATTSIGGQKPANGPIASPICINQVIPTKAAITDGRYSFWNFEHLYTNTSLTPEKRIAVEDFLRYLCDDTYKQNQLVGSGFLRLSDLQDSVFAARQVAVGQTVRECKPSDIPTY